MIVRLLAGTHGLPVPSLTSIIIPMGRLPDRSRGRPRNRQTKLSSWIDEKGLTRDVVAARLGIGRTYLDKLCRGASRPSLELALQIERLTSGAVVASEWLSVPPHSGD
jgi:DNA-binding XRE family transcriptional regulator